jgi:hypothetical protein
VGDKDLLKAASKVFKAADLVPTPSGASRNMRAVQNAFQEADSEDRDGEVLFDGVFHEDSYEPLVDEHGKKILPLDVPVAPIDP